MELRQLRYFVKIAELGSLSKAAQALHVAQPALSYQMAQLEQELGVRLLHRSRVGVQMSEAGLAFYRKAQRVLRELQDLPNAVAQSALELTGSVALGLPQSTAAQFAMPLLEALRITHPGIRLEIFDEISGNLAASVHGGRFDLAVLVSDEDAALLDATPLMDEELFFVSRSAPDGALPVQALCERPLALPGVQHGVRKLVEEAVRRAGAELPTPWIVANSMSVMLRAIRDGQACSVMPWGAVCDALQAGVLHATPLSPPLSRRVYLCQPRDAELSLSAQAVREQLLATVRGRVAVGAWHGARLVGAGAS